MSSCSWDKWYISSILNNTNQLTVLDRSRSRSISSYYSDSSSSSSSSIGILKHNSGKALWIKVIDWLFFVDTIWSIHCCYNINLISRLILLYRQYTCTTQCGISYTSSRKLSRSELAFFWFLKFEYILPHWFLWAAAQFFDTFLM